MRIPDTSKGCKIGERYKVPCVRAGRKNKPYWAAPGEWIPILLPKHADKEFINFPYPHWHIDFRFLHERTHAAMWKDEVFGIRSLTERYALAWFRVAQPVCETDLKGLPMLAVTEPVLRVRTCLRAPLKVCPTVSWHKPLEKALEGQAVKNGRCPHRGIDVSDCRVLDGKFMCPAHGWVFQVSGEIVTGAEAAEFRKQLAQAI